MPIISTRGVASAKALGLASGLGATYIEDVFSAYTYKGTGATQTITNGIDLAGKGGLVWGKSRSHITDGHHLTDTVRGTQYYLKSETSAAQVDATTAAMVQSVSSTGYTLGASSYMNDSAKTYASWTFRKQPKFFDIVTYTGNGVAGRQISHNLGSVPGFIVVKSTSHATIWAGYHRSLDATKLIRLNTTDAAITNSTMWNDTEPTSTVFSVGTAQGTNEETLTYVAYLFAHNAGGFGLTGTDNVISCGTYTGVGANLNINLGYEPQWVMIKCTTDAVNWIIFDTMRGLPTSGNGKDLRPNVTDAEGDNSALSITSTGFLARTGIDGQVNATGRSYIYIAIRRGPMKVPTTGTSVFGIYAKPTLETRNQINPGFTSDAMIVKNTSGGTASGAYWFDRLRGMVNPSPFLISSGSTIETTEAGKQYAQSGESNSLANVGPGINSNLQYNDPTNSSIFWFFRRAPGFFDVVCYTGNGGNMTISHNLGVVPTLMIVKGRNATAGAQWKVYDVFDGNDNYMALNTTAATASGYGAYWNTTTPTSTVFYVGSNNTTNTGTQVAYLFATCPGVSKVGSYTGNGTTQTINCGFATGARFILIKRTDAVGDWYVWDSARGIVAGNDPHLSLNTTVAEVTTDDSVDTDSSGFIVNQLAATNINVSAATYIFLAIS